MSFPSPTVVPGETLKVQTLPKVLTRQKEKLGRLRQRVQLSPRKNLNRNNQKKKGKKKKNFIQKKKKKGRILYFDL